jgi:hypothetical protein
MNTARYVARASGAAARMFDGEMMILSPSEPTLFTLNEVATVIWQAADGSTSLDSIVATRICAEYDVPPDVALEDASQLVEELARHGLLLISDQPMTHAVAKEVPGETS